MDYWGCDADGIFCRSSKDSILNFGGVLSGAEDPIAGTGFGGVSDSRSAGDRSGSRVPLAAALPLMSSSSERSRRGRARGGANLQNARCQVYGCDKDLGSCKEYHKRHKVCEAHTKTAKVIVNGVEQRFCQQCSRFHLLPEFDDGKRSCRKRLAGHNARRRKPRPSLHSIGGPRNMAFPRCGIEYSMNAHPMTSFIRRDIIPCHNPISSEKLWFSNGFGVLKPEAGLNCDAQSAIGFIPDFPCHSLDELDFNNSGGFSAAGAQFGQRPNPVLQLLLWEDKTPLRSGGNSMVDSPTWTDQGLLGVPKSTRALSLLSSQSRTGSDHASGIPVGRSSAMHDTESRCMTRPPIMLNQPALAKGPSDVFYSLTEETHF